MSDLQVKFSPDAKSIAYKESSSSSLYLYNIPTGLSYQIANESTTSFSFSYDGLFLAFADGSGNIFIYNIKSNKTIEKFENISNSNFKIVSLLFHYENTTNFLISVDSNSTIYVSNVDKMVAKMHVYERHLFTDKFDGLGKIKAILSCQEDGAEVRPMVYVLFEHNFILLNLTSGKFSKKQTSIPCVLDSDYLSASSSSHNLLAKVDKNTIIKFKNKLKYNEPLTNIFELCFKKRFANRIIDFSAIVDSYCLVLEADKTLNILKSEKDLTKVKVIYNTVSDSQTHQIGKKPRSQKPRKAQHAHTNSCFDQEKSKILFAGVVQSSKIILAHGDSFLNFRVEIRNFDELLSSANSKKEILLKLSDENESEKNPTGLSGLPEKLTAVVKSDKNVDFDEISGHKRRFEELTEANSNKSKVKTIGETLEERLDFKNLNLDSNKKGNQVGIDVDAEETELNSNDKSITLSQAIQAEALPTIKEIILKGSENPEIIYQTIKNLQKIFIVPFMKILSDVIKSPHITTSSEPDSCASFDGFTISNTSLEWLKLLLKLHPNYILSDAAKSQKSLLKIHQLAEEKRKYSSILNKLGGKISYFLSEPSGSSSSPSNGLQFSSAQSMSRSLYSSSIKPQFIYEADDDSPASSDSTFESSENEESDQEMDFFSELEAGSEIEFGEEMEDGDPDDDDRDDDDETMSDKSLNFYESNNNINEKLSDKRSLVVNDRKRKKPASRKFAGLESPSSSGNEALEPVKV